MRNERVVHIMYDHSEKDIIKEWTGETFKATRALKGVYIRVQVKKKINK